MRSHESIQLSVPGDSSGAALFRTFFLSSSSSVLSLIHPATLIAGVFRPAMVASEDRILVHRNSIGRSNCQIRRRACRSSGRWFGHRYLVYSTLSIVLSRQRLTTKPADELSPFASNRTWPITVSASCERSAFATRRALKEPARLTARAHACTAA